MSLSDALEKARTEMMKKVGGALDALGGVAGRLEMKDTSGRLSDVRKNLESERFTLIVLGRFKNGKSTLMNALLGRLTHPVPELQNTQGPMPVDDLPTTATLTSIDYADKPSVRVWRTTGKSESWSLEKYLRESVVKTHSQRDNEEFFKDIRQFEMKLPAELCSSGVTLMDSPGLDDVTTRTAITLQAVEHADAAIVVYRHDVFAGESERQTADRVVNSGTRVFTVINRINGKVLDDRWKAFVWNRLITEEQKGPEYNGQPLSERDIYPVDALTAVVAKHAGDAHKLEESGMAALEKRLGEFLLNERFQSHVNKHIKMADQAATAIEQQIAQRNAALKQEGENLQRAYEAIQPQLANIRKKRDGLPKIFERYRREAQRELRASFEELIKRVREELPDDLASRTLPTLESKSGLIAQFRQKRLCSEAVDACNEIITDKLNAWGSVKPPKPGAQQALGPILEGLLEELRDEVAQIDRQLNEVHVRLTGWSPQTAAPTSVISVQERVLSGAAGLLVGDFSSLLGAGGGGWRGVAGNLVGQLAAGTILIALGLSGTVVFLPVVLGAGIAANIIWGAHGLDRRVKARALEAVLPGLSKATEEAAPHIDAEIERMFKELETSIVKSVMTVIEEEELNIKKMVELNKRSREQKKKDLAALEEAQRIVSEQRTALKQAVVTASQVGPIPASKPQAAAGPSAPVLPCPACGAKNRVADSGNGHAVCGKCGAKLATSGSAGVVEPV